MNVGDQGLDTALLEVLDEQAGRTVRVSFDLLLSPDDPSNLRIASPSRQRGLDVADGRVPRLKDDHEVDPLFGAVGRIAAGLNGVAALEFFDARGAATGELIERRVSVVLLAAQLVRRVTTLHESSPSLLLSIAIMAAFVGFAVELLMRGWAITELRGVGLSKGAVIAVSSALFGLWHVPNILLDPSAVQVVQQVVFTMLAGVAFYCVRRVTGKLWPAMAAHAAWDFAVS
nr:CPBP family intramembrane glutamic endopeptidase [Bowdeniella massiliensis]